MLHGRAGIDAAGFAEIALAWGACERLGLIPNLESIIALAIL
jgi:hypothetical protein